MKKKTLALLLACWAGAWSAVDLKYVMFKLDDVQAHWPYVVGMWTNVANTFISNGLHASFGLIGNDTELYGETYPEFWAWFQHCQSNGIQFWNHTFDHTDLTAFDRSGQWWQMARNQNLVRRKSGSNLGGYGAPMNLNNGDTLAVVRDMDALDFWFFGNSNSVKRNLLRFGDMESPTLVPNYAAFTSNWGKTLSNCSNANADYLVLQGHPGSWDTNRFTNFLNVLAFLTNQGYLIVNPAEYLRIKTENLSILEPELESSFVPGQSVTGLLTGSNVTWSVDLWDGDASQNLASGSGTNLTFTVPTWANRTNRIRLNASASGFTRSRSFGVAPLSTNDLAQACPAVATSSAMGHDAGAAVDRSLATGWSPAGALPQSLTLDLGSAKQVAGAHLAWKPGYHADAYDLKGSLDGVTFFPLCTNDVGWGGSEQADFAATNLRYLRMTVSRAIRMDGGVELSEMFAFAGIPAAKIETNLIVAEADAMVHSSYPGSNFGARMIHEVLSANGRHAYLRFDLSSVSRPVTRAKLFLYPSSGAQIDALHSLKFVSNNNWDEMGVVWSNRPALGPTLGVQAPFYWRSEFDVTWVVTQALSGDRKVSFAICGTNGTYMTYISREETNYGGLRAPALELGYDPILPPAPAPFLSVQITNPPTAISLSNLPSVVPLHAVTVESNTTVTQVRFAVDGTNLSLDTNGADGYTAAWNVVGAGTHTLSAIASGSTGLEATNQRLVSVTLPVSTNATNAAVLAQVLAVPGSITTNRIFTNALAVTGGTGYWSTNGSAFVPFGEATNLVIRANTRLDFYACSSNGLPGATNSVAYILEAGTIREARADLDPVGRSVVLSFALSANTAAPPEASVRYFFRAEGQQAWTPIPADEVRGAGAPSWNATHSNVWKPGPWLTGAKALELCLEAEAGGLVMSAPIAGLLDWSKAFRAGTTLDGALAVGSPWRGEGIGIYFVNLTPDAEILIFSSAGQWVQQVRAASPDGNALWDLHDRQGRQVPPGVYLCHVKSGVGVKTLRVVVAR